MPTMNLRSWPVWLPVLSIIPLLFFVACFHKGSALSPRHDCHADPPNYDIFSSFKPSQLYGNETLALRLTLDQGDHLAQRLDTLHAQITRVRMCTSRANQQLTFGLPVMLRQRSMSPKRPTVRVSRAVDELPFLIGDCKNAAASAISQSRRAAAGVGKRLEDIRGQVEAYNRKIERSKMKPTPADGQSQRRRKDFASSLQTGLGMLERQQKALEAIVLRLGEVHTATKLVAKAQNSGVELWVAYYSMMEALLDADQADVLDDYVRTLCADPLGELYAEL